MTKNAAKSRDFVKFARSASPEFAHLPRNCADDEAILDLLPDDGHWDLPHRLDAAVEWLIETGDAPDHTTAPDPWTTYRATILGHSAWVGEFVRTYRVQTNEVQRCFALLPIFLALSATYRRPLRLIELGASVGLNLLWDRYRYRYHNGRWGAATARLELAGEERRTVPADVLRSEVRISSRVGIDLNPLDVSDADDVRLLRVFAARHRRGRLMDAIATAQTDPPTLIRGDYLELLPGLLAQRDEATLTVVFQTLSAVYLGEEQKARLRSIVDEAGSAGPLAYVWTPTPEEHGQRQGDYPIELATWPGPQRRFIARMENHGEWLDWVG